MKGEIMNSKYITILSIFLFFAISLSLSEERTFAQDTDIEVYLENERINLDVPPILQEGTTMVQFRPIFEKLGLSIQWDERTKKITTTQDGLKLELQVGSKISYVNGQKRELDVPVIMSDGNTLVPLRFIAEATAKKVTWDSYSRKIKIERGVEVLLVKKQFGNASYEPKNNSDELGQTNPIITERAGYTYVLWSHNITIGRSDSYTYFYVSIAKDNQWIARNKIIKQVQKDTITSSLIVGTSIFLRDDSGVRKIDVDANGDIASDSTIIESPKLIKYFYASEREYMYPVDSKEGTRIIFGPKSSLKIYNVDKPSATIYSITDIHKMLDKKYQMLVFDEAKSRLLLIQGVEIKEMSILTGQMTYDENGKDKITKPVPNSLSAPLFYNGEIYYLFNDTDRRVKIASVDVDLNTNMQQTNLSAGSGSNYMLTQTDEYFKLWNNSKFERLPSLDLTVLSKIR
jgi:hypothetical protein